MQTFKQYFETFLVERREMMRNISKLEKIVNQIGEHVKNLPNFEHGTRIEVPMGNKQVSIIFYYSLPTKVKKLTKVNSRTDAVYIPSNDRYFKEFSGSICIALSNVYKGQSIPNPFEYTKKYFPSDVKNVLIHELRHAWEDIIKKISKHTFKQNPSELNKVKRYYNNSTELNAHISEFVYKELTTNTVVYNLIQDLDIRSAKRLLMDEIKDEAFFRYAHPNNRRWILKTAYTLFDQYLTKIIERLKNKDK